MERQTESFVWIALLMIVYPLALPGYWLMLWGDRSSVLPQRQRRLL